MKTLLLAALSVLSIGPLGAQTASAKLPPLPPGPLPAHLDRAQWTVTIVPDQSGAAAPGKGAAANATTVTIAKDKDVREITIQEPGNSPVVFWILKGAQYTTQRDGSWSPVDSGSGTVAASYSHSDFPECACVQPGNYHAVSQVQNRPCFVFSATVQTVTDAYLAQLKQNADPGQQISSDQFMAASEVDLDMATTLPLKTHFNGKLYTYQYSANPPSLAAPASLLLMLKNQQRLFNDYNRTPAHA